MRADGAFGGRDSPADGVFGGGDLLADGAFKGGDLPADGAFGGGDLPADLPAVGALAPAAGALAPLLLISGTLTCEKHHIKDLEYKRLDDHVTSTFLQPLDVRAASIAFFTALETMPTNLP